MSTEQQVQGWFYVDREREKQGPFPPPEFKALADQGIITGDTPVWTEGYTYWIPAGKLEGLVPASAPPTLPATAESPPEPITVAPIPAHPSTAGLSPVSAAPSAATLSNTGQTMTPMPKPDAIPSAELKPRRGSFVFPRTMIGLGVALALTLVLSIVFMGSEYFLLLCALSFLVSAALAVVAPQVSYRKERYELHDSTVVCHRGGLVSDQTTELEIRNITHVKVKLPWLRYKLFGVGDVLIESAGNSQPVALRSIRGPEEVYAEMAERMKRNGYDLTQGELLHEEQPAIRGVLTECLSMAVGTFFVLAFAMPTILGLSDGAANVGFGWLPWVLAPLLIVAGMVFLVVHFLDLRRRTYRVFNDVVVYEEGFLTRQNAFIPYENIADAATKRSFLDQVLNLFDVVISCQGSSSEIKFRRLQHGLQLSECIDRLVLAAGRKPAPAGAAGNDAGSSSVATLSRRDEPALVAPSDAWIADLKMNPARVLVPLTLLFPLLPIWLFAMVQAGVKLMSTRYAVRPGSIRHSFRFLTTHDREFAYDKITGLVIKENPWDRLFGTVTLRFWSIGSGQSLELAHVSRADLDLEAIQRQIGIPAASAHPHEVTAKMGLVSWLRARCYRIALAVLASAGLVVAAVKSGEAIFYGGIGLLAILFATGFAYALLYFRRQRLRFHDHHVEAEQGVIARRRYFACYRNVKKTQVTRYPGGDEGALQVFVAGEQQHAQQAENQGKSKVTVPCSFTLGFLPEVDGRGTLLDDILCGRVNPSPEATPAEPLEIFLETRRAVGNSVFTVVLFSVVLVPLVALLPLTLPLAIYATKKWRYRVDAGRVTASWGVLFKKHASILLDRVDSLQQQQGPLNKLFKNGNVRIMTAGSSKPDLVLHAAPEYQALYQEIRQRSQGT